MGKKIKEKIKKLPKTSGVYIFRDKDKRIIYVGKAVSLKNRVSSYFTYEKDIKTEKLVLNIHDLNYLKTESEIGAIILESELIKRYKPKFNIELKDDKNFVYLKMPKEDFPLPVLVRNPADDKATYLGPFIDALVLRRVIKMLRKIFPFRSAGDITAKRPCLYYHLGQCPGVCVGKISKKDYAKNMKGIVAFFEGKSKKLEKEFEKEMKKASKSGDFETAAIYRDKMLDLRKINRMHFLKEEDFGKLDKALHGLKRFGLKNIPKRIECFDISNIQGKEAVGSMVVFENGLPTKAEYRKFKIKILKEPNDVAMMGEMLERRFANAKKMRRGWDKLPDLVVLDGGNGQLGKVLEVLKSFDIDIPVIGIAKKNEEIFMRVWNPRVKAFSFQKTILPKSSETLYLLQRLRDEAHRFAIQYFRNLHQKVSRGSALDDISGLGPKTKRKLINRFGSISGIRSASVGELEEAVGEKLAKKIKEIL